MTRYIFSIIVLFFAAGIFQAEVAYCMTVEGLSSLNFGVILVGSSADSVSPGSEENEANGSFRITGDPEQICTIILPLSGQMITGAGGANRTVDLSDFQTNPSAEGSVVLDENGILTVFVGATRAAVLTGQESGAYSGSFEVQVVIE